MSDRSKHIIVNLVLLMAVGLQDAIGQCAMCKAAAETSLASGSNAAAAVNSGVFYLMLMPFLMICTIGYFWWRANRKLDQTE